MPFEIQLVTLTDFDYIATLSEEPLGSLIDPVLFDVWPVSTNAESLRRSAWSAQQDKGRFQLDPTVKFVKVVDTGCLDLDHGEGTARKEIVSLARWHYYPDGYPQENTWMEIDVFARPPAVPSFPEGLDGEEMQSFLSEATAERGRWELTKKGSPCWILTTLVTRRGWRGKGAGGMLVEWGVTKAEEMGVVACLEADPMAVGLYERFGFGKWGGEEVVGLVKMYRPVPKAA